MTTETKDKLRDNRDKAKSLSTRIEKLRREAHAFAEADPFHGVQTPVYKLNGETAVPQFAWKVDPASPVGRALEGMGFLAESMRQTSTEFGKYLRRSAQTERGLDFIVGWILWCNEDFHSWDAVVSLFNENAISVDDRVLRKKAALIRKTRKASRQRERQGENRLWPRH